MNRKPRDPALLGLLLFVVASSAGSAVVADVYTTGARRIEADALSYPGNRLLARPLQIAVGDTLSETGIVGHLTRVGYVQTSVGNQPGSFAVKDGHISIAPRYQEFPALEVAVLNGSISSITSISNNAELDTAELEPETILAFEPDGWTGMVQRELPYVSVQGTALEDALLASEDNHFWDHHGLDLVRLAFAPILGGGASTLTMQLARLNVLRDRARTVRRKVAEIGVAMALERKYPKQDLLLAYVNAAYLGTSRGRQVHGFAAAAQEFFGVRDVRQLDVTQAATLVALLNQPARYLNELRSGDESLLRRQRNRVLDLMVRSRPDRYQAASIRDLQRDPVSFREDSSGSDLEAVSQWYLDSIAGEIPRTARTRAYTSLAPSLQRLAQQVVADGLAQLEDRNPSTRGRLQAALVAVDPRGGELLAMTGGKSHDQSQFNRAVSAKRQVGSLIKAFDLAAALERGVEEGRTDLTPATVVLDAPTRFVFNGRPWAPANYGHEYSGMISWRRAIALSRNVPAVKIAETAGFDRVARLWWNATGINASPVYPSIALGAVEATPMEIARAYSVFANGGIARPLRSIGRVVERDRHRESPQHADNRVLRHDVAFVVADTLRAVLDEGTARAVRAAGLSFPAAGKTGTTDDMRDAWFVGFTPDLLVVVWVGTDDNHTTGLTGAQAALPIWTAFMAGAGSHNRSSDFTIPEGVTFARIDSASGFIAGPACPTHVRQAFLSGTQPTRMCPRHPR